MGLLTLTSNISEPHSHHVLFMSDLLPSCCYFSQCPLSVLNEDVEHLVTSHILLSLFYHPAPFSSLAFINFSY